MFRDQQITMRWPRWPSPLCIVYSICVFLFFHFKLIVVHCRSAAMVKRLPKDLEVWKWVKGSNDRLETVGCGYTWCVEESNRKQKTANTILITPSHLRMEGPEWNLWYGAHISMCSFDIEKDRGSFMKPGEIQARTTAFRKLSNGVASR